MSAVQWLDTNQRVLVAEFARIRALIAEEDVCEADRLLAAARATLSSPAAIDRVSEAFGLTPFERDVLLLCAGAEMDAAVTEALARTSANERPHPSFGLALARLPESHWSALTPVRPLRRWRLIQLSEERGLTSAPLIIDERLLHFLAGCNYLDPQLDIFLRAAKEESELQASLAGVVTSAIAAIAALETDAARVQLVGDDPAAQRGVAHNIARALGLQLHVIRAAELPALPREQEDLATRWYREALLLESALYLETTEESATAALRFAARLKGLIFIASRDPLADQPAHLRFTVDRPTSTEQKDLWISTLGDPARSLNGSLDALVTQFRLDTGAIRQTAAALPEEQRAPELLGRALWNACRIQTRRQLNGLAQPVDCSARWSDLVLPEAQVAMLRQIAAHARHRLEVYERWGFASKSRRGLGISVLFCGESGTGKTMAAEVLASELDLDLYRIDLAAMVSKYIGETEKNLRKVFDAAEESGAILLFDEADALFGGRSEVKDSNDRYANIEVSYLLQRMEAYRGLAILTTNLKNSIDPAFQRRLRFMIQFPFPDEQHRERIWRGIFPAAMPRSSLDYRKLAQLNVAGGHIRNIALGAAFIAADAGIALGMSHLLQAARSESGKRERPFSDAELRGWQ